MTTIGLGLLAVLVLGLICAIPLVWVGGVALLVVAGRQVRGRQVAAWRRLADELGLTFDPGSLFRQPAVHGRWDGRAVWLGMTVRVESGSPARHREATVRLSLANPGGIHLNLAEAGIFPQLDQRVYGPRTSVGRADFDRRFHLHARPEAAARTVIGAGDLADRLMAQPRLWLTVAGHELTCRRLDWLSDPAELDTLFSLLRDIARVVENPGPESVDGAGGAGPVDAQPESLTPGSG